MTPAGTTQGDDSSPGAEDRVYCRVLGRAGARRLECPATTLVDAVRFEPAAGVYTVDRTYPGEQVLALDRHFDRLENSAVREGIPLHLDRDALRGCIRDLLRESGFESGRFRMSVAESSPGDVRITLERFRPVPAAFRQRGVRCVLVRMQRNRPESKTLGWMHGRIETPLPEGAYEGLLVSRSEEVLEGLSSNFFAVRGGELQTAESQVLPGIARRIVLEISSAILPSTLSPIQTTQLGECEEAFLTSSTRGIIPIAAVDDVPISSGQPGQRTRAIEVAYLEWVEKHLEPLCP